VGVLPGPEPSYPEHPKEDSTMFEPQTVSATDRLEWGPAHLREDATTYEYEPTERPDDN